ncbi:hypothetical protein CEE39_01065 [bacterium (candidate division B38) B3_B38]|nr:MAG: hypothetical protein CEE39_01065 [bacterium (candidate division B38) B3_B38]
MRTALHENLGLELIIVDAVDQFMTALSGITDPEKKRRTIGELFIRIFEEIQAGDCKRLTKNHFLLIDHHEAMRDSVREIAGAEDFELDPSVTWTVDRDQRIHPATEEERAALLRSRIHFGVSNYLSGGGVEAGSYDEAVVWAEKMLGVPVIDLAESSNGTGSEQHRLS